MDTFGTILEKIGQLFISSSGHTDVDSQQQQERQENKKERRKERKKERGATKYIKRTLLQIREPSSRAANGRKM